MTTMLDVRHRMKRFLPVVLLAFLLSACATPPGPKTTVGSMGGAAAGGLIGAAAGGGAEGIIAGVLLGGLLGGAVGNALDNADRQYMDRNAQYTLEAGRTGMASTWQNPDSGHYGSITPTRTYQNAAGQNCREFQQAVTVGGQTEQAYGTACRQPDGTWKIVQ